MGEEADYQIDQMINAEWWSDRETSIEDDYYSYGYDPIHGRVIKITTQQAAENEMEEFKMAEVKKTYSFDINSEKKIYRIKPPLARGSFMQRILEPEGYEEGDDPEWGCQLRWPMDDPEVKLWVADMGKLFTKIFIDKFGKEKAAKLMANPSVRIPLRNGNNESNDEYEGWFFMNVRNKFRQPMIIGPTGKALPTDMITDQVIYSGAWYRSRITVKHFEVKGHVIGAFVDILMKIKDDDRLDNIIDVGKAEDEFSEFATEDAGMDDAAFGLDAEDDNPFTTDEEDKKKAKDEDDDFSFLE